jgi:hypothetical protein
MQDRSSLAGVRGNEIPSQVDYLSPPQAGQQGKYMIHKNGEELGPYEKQKLLENLKNGYLNLEDRAWQPGMERWEPLRYHISTQDLIDYGIKASKIQNPNGSPIHLQTALVVMALDGIWSVAEIGAYISIAGIIPALFVSVLVGVVAYFVVKSIQQKAAGDTPDEAHTKALTMAILCGVPFPFLGTGAGAIFLGWAGIRGSKVRTQTT